MGSTWYIMNEKAVFGWRTELYLGEVFAPVLY